MRISDWSSDVCSSDLSVTVASTARSLRVVTDKVGRADSPGVASAKSNVSDSPEQRSASTPSAVPNTTQPPASERIVPDTLSRTPVAGLVRTSATDRPREALSNADGLSRAGSSEEKQTDITHTMRNTYDG